MFYFFQDSCHQNIALIVDHGGNKQKTLQEKIQPISISRILQQRECLRPSQLPRACAVRGLRWPPEVHVLHVSARVQTGLRQQQ